MTIRHAIWRVGAAPEPLQPAALNSEAQLEDMIVAAPSILHDAWMLIGRQVDTGFGGKLDLLAITPDGTLVLIELKRDRTPRDVIARAIDYATIAIVPFESPVRVARDQMGSTKNGSLADDRHANTVRLNEGVAGFSQPVGGDVRGAEPRPPASGPVDGPRGTGPAGGQERLLEGDASEQFPRCSRWRRRRSWRGSHGCGTPVLEPTGSEL